MKIFNKGKKYLEKESDLVYIIKKLRSKKKNIENGMKILNFDNSEISDESAEEDKQGQIHMKPQDKKIWHGKVFKKDRGDLIPSLKVKKK